jgi:polar amino acid transport system substrate-binding protein
LQSEINRCERFNHTFGVAILDIDYFKKVNDTFGHQTGDKVLIEISNILSLHMRKTDYVGRFGGEEFLIICPESNKDGILNLIENIRLDIANYTFKEVGNITASFGIALLKRKDSVESLLKRADVALYRAKETGKNKTIIGDS